MHWAAVADTAAITRDEATILALVLAGVVAVGLLLVLGWLLRPSSPSEKARRKRRAERERKRVEDRAREAALCEQHRREDWEKRRIAWLQRLRAEMVGVETDITVKQAIRVAGDLTLMVRSVFDLGGIAFNEKRFREAVAELWKHLQQPSFQDCPTLYSHLDTILKGYARGWESIENSGCSVPQFIAGGFGIKGALQAMALAYGIQAVADSIASGITNARMKAGMIEWAKAADAYADLDQIRPKATGASREAL